MAKFTPMLAVFVCLGGLGTLHAQGAVKPIGKWERKIDKRHVTLVVEEHRLHLTVLDNKPCVLHADYSVTKDGIVYGVVTSVECDDPDDEDDAKALVDAPFSCRFRIDEGALIIRDLKSQEMGNKDDMWNGRFKAVPSAPVRTSLVPYPPEVSFDIISGARPQSSVTVAPRGVKKPPSFVPKRALFFLPASYEEEAKPLNFAFGGCSLSR